MLDKLQQIVQRVNAAANLLVVQQETRRVFAKDRYTTSLAIRDQMVTRGGLTEGYGPDSVALCALP